ncbi:MAG: toll/interleukin-1 receptor domain-containing protein [Microscillaceae bacterium]|jgi:hypothetical protein|nr:toll/interleukin-1 receptor domain-containing protein [Microscillaceae bacterium]
MKDVFISYATKDQAAKEDLKQLFDNQGISYWLDETSMEIGNHLDTQIESGLREARFTVLLVSENSLLSTWVSKESLFRLKEEIFTGKTTLLPILLDNKVFEDDFPFRMHDKFTAEIEKQKNLRAQAETRKMKTALYNERIERLEEILPNITEIIAKLTGSLSANFADPARKSNDLEKLIQTIQNQAIDSQKEAKPDTLTFTKTISLPQEGDAGITQTIVSFDGILKMEQALFTPKKILWLCPQGQNNTAGISNFNQIKEALQSSEKREQFGLEMESEVNLDNFLRIVMQHEPHFLHLYLPPQPQNELYLPNAQGEIQNLSIGDWSDFFALIQQKYTPELLILSASQSLAYAQALKPYVGQVIGFEEVINEKAMALYLAKLYELIFDGESIEFAHNSAKLNLKMAKIAPAGKLTTHEVPQLI